MSLAYVSIYTENVSPFSFEKPALSTHWIVIDIRIPPTPLLTVLLFMIMWGGGEALPMQNRRNCTRGSPFFSILQTEYEGQVDHFKTFDCGSIFHWTVSPFQMFHALVFKSVGRATADREWLRCRTRWSSECQPLCTLLVILITIYHRERHRVAS